VRIASIACVVIALSSLLGSVAPAAHFSLSGRAAVVGAARGAALLPGWRRRGDAHGPLCSAASPCTRMRYADPLGAPGGAAVSVDGAKVGAAEAAQQVVELLVSRLDELAVAAPLVAAGEEVLQHPRDTLLSPRPVAWPLTPQ